MGHYSEYYERSEAEARRRKKIVYRGALADLIAFRQWNAKGKKNGWAFSDLGLEKEYEALVDKLKARLYDMETYDN